MTPQRVLIIGAGFAGLECALKLANDHRFEVTLLDRTNHHLFQPLLYHVATCSLSAPDISRSIRSVTAHADNITVLMDEVEEINAELQTVKGESGRAYPYDRLVVAVGARTGYFGNNHWAEHTIGMKSLGDAYKVRRTVLHNLEQAEITDDDALRKKLLTIAIVGGGPTGVELAGAFVELIKGSMQRNFRRLDTNELRVILIEAAPRLLPPFAEDHSAYTEKRLKDLGVDVRTGTMVTDVQTEKLVLGDETIEANTIIWAAGVEANPVTKQLPCEVDRGGRVTPNLDLSLPNHPEIFVAGDITRMMDATGKPVPGVGPAAVQMGKHIAKILKEEAKPGFNTELSKRYDLRPKFTYWDKGMMAIIGKYSAVMQSGKVKATGPFAWLSWLFVHLAFLIGFRNKLSVLLNWAWAFLSGKPGNRVYAKSEINLPKS